VAVWIVAVLLLDRSRRSGSSTCSGSARGWSCSPCCAAGPRDARAGGGRRRVRDRSSSSVFAGWLGVYVYRLDNVPLFVPPGHGLVYLAGALDRPQRLGARARPACCSAATLVVGGAWALWGVTLATGPTRSAPSGTAACCCSPGAGRSPLLYAGAFLVVSGLELLGTSLGT
jgi:hypothetical protein